MIIFVKKNMLSSNFWYYVIFVIVILHVIAGFVYIAIKLSPKKDKKKDNKKSL